MKKWYWWKRGPRQLHSLPSLTKYLEVVSRFLWAMTGWENKNTDQLKNTRHYGTCSTQSVAVSAKPNYQNVTLHYSQNFRRHAFEKQNARNTAGVTRITVTGLNIEWGQLPLSLKAKLNQTVLTWEFPTLNVYLLVKPFILSLRLSQSWPHPLLDKK